MKKFIVKLIVFLGILLVIQNMLAQTVLANFLNNQERISVVIDEIFSQQVDILYLGDSTLFFYPDADKNKSSIPMILDDMLPEMKIIELSHAAYHMDIYKEIIKYIVAKGYSPKVIIVPINLRAFSAAGYNPNYQFEKQKQELRISSSNILRPFIFFTYWLVLPEGNLTQEEFLDSPVYNGSEVVGKIRDFTEGDYSEATDEEVKKQIIYQYMFSLNEDHPKVQSLVDIIRAVEGTNIQILFYITPLDYLTGEKFLGEQFNQRLEENIGLFTKVISEEGGNYLNLAYALETPEFYWSIYPNEHMNFTGRTIVAKSLATEILTHYLVEVP